MGGRFVTIDVEGPKVIHRKGNRVLSFEENEVGKTTFPNTVLGT